jgi:hypothetical protein
MFGCHRHRYFCGLAQDFEGRAVAAFGVRATQVQPLLSTAQVPHKSCGTDALGGHGAHCGSEYAKTRTRNSNVDAYDRYFACRKYEEEIEDDVEQAHTHAEQSRYFHVPGASQHSACQIVQYKYRQSRDESGEIDCGSVAYGAFSTKPYRQLPGYRQAEKRYHGSGYKAGHYSLA